MQPRELRLPPLPEPEVIMAQSRSVNYDRNQRIGYGIGLVIRGTWLVFWNGLKIAALLYLMYLVLA